MVDNDTHTVVLTELDSIANAAMTGEQREMRAAPVLAMGGVDVAGLRDALGGRGPALEREEGVGLRGVGGGMA